MSLPELSTPIRIYWDLTPLPADPPDHEKIAADIIALKILNLDLTATGDSIPQSCFNVLKMFHTARLGVTLTITPSALTKPALTGLLTALPKELLLEVTDVQDLCSVTPLPLHVAGVSFPLSERNWQQIPDVVSFCSEHGFRRLVLPMQRLYSGEQPFHIPGPGLAEIAAKLSSFTPATSLKMTVHDPFVWRAIFPHSPFPEGRCQAANTMLSIDQKGTVYPCPVMPVPLGNLGTMTLKDIAKGEAKRELRSKLLALPAECAECSDAESCKGGCRGRGERVFGTWDALDPGCR